MDRPQDKTAIEAPGEGAEVARQMLGGDGAVRGEEAVLDVGEHGVRPAEGRVAGAGAVGAGDVAFMNDAGLLGDAAKPLAAVADDGGSRLDIRAQPFGFDRLEPAYDLETGMQRPSVRGGLDRDNEGRMSAPAEAGAFAGSLAANIGVVDLDPWPGGAEL